MDAFLFNQRLRAFAAAVEAETGVPLSSVRRHPFIEEKENYKRRLHPIAYERLKPREWREADVGTGRIAAATREAVEVDATDEVPRNNLVFWQGRYGPRSKPQRALWEAKGDRLAGIESALLHLYRDGDSPEGAFRRLVDGFGRKYDLLAYLFFLKDEARYAPISTKGFDHGLGLLGFDLKTSQRASWENYEAFNGALREVRDALTDALGAPADLLDAHSFVWTLAWFVHPRGGPPPPQSTAPREAEEPVEAYRAMGEKDREAVVRARLGQGAFRARLLQDSGSCAVTGCEAPALLRASHIKPWRDSDAREALDPLNGLLLTPSYDAAFDAGLISFADDGRLLASPSLAPEDAARAGIDVSARLRHVGEGRAAYLGYHREHVFEGP